MDIIPFKQEHAQYILSQQLNAKELYLRPEHRKYALYLEQVGLSFTALINNKPIAAGGIFVLWDGVAEGWVMATKDVWRYRVSMARNFKEKFDILVKTSKVKRIQTNVKADFELGHKFAIWLGFEKEGLMKYYGPDGSDYVRYARIMI